MSSAGNNKVLRYAASGAPGVFSQCRPARCPITRLQSCRTFPIAIRVTLRVAIVRAPALVGSDRSARASTSALINGLSVAWYNYEETGAHVYLATGALQGTLFQAPLQRVSGTQQRERDGCRYDRLEFTAETARR